MHLQFFGAMGGPVIRKFGALELASGALWLGWPHARFRPGIRLGSDGLSQWGAPGPREHARESITGLEVLVGEPEERGGGLTRALDRIDSAADWFSLAIGMSARWSREENDGVRLDWKSTSAQEKYWAAAAVNWPEPLSEPERHAARAVPSALVRSASLRDLLRSAEATAALLSDLTQTTSRGDVDRILAQRS